MLVGREASFLKAPARIKVRDPGVFACLTDALNPLTGHRPDFCHFQ